MYHDLSLDWDWSDAALAMIAQELSENRIARKAFRAAPTRFVFAEFADFPQELLLNVSFHLDTVEFFFGHSVTTSRGE